MAVSIDWSTFVIMVPRADMPIIQASPEIRSLDMDWFRNQLNDIEDSPEGMPHPDTHRHNTTVTLSGVTYSRVVEIINGYTIEFEDGQYTVSLTGGNNNVLDVKVANQVSVLGSNSAGQVDVGSGLSTEQATRLNEIWRRLELDPDNPLVDTESGGTRTTTAGDDITIVRTGDGVTNLTSTRQP